MLGDKLPSILDQDTEQIKFRWSQVDFIATTISTTNWDTDHMHEMITHRDGDPAISFRRGEVSIISVKVPPSLERLRVNDMAIPGEINVITITREEEALVPTPNTEFRCGDTLHLAVLVTAIYRLDSCSGYNRRRIYLSA